MRSRYSAYVRSDIDYLLRTWHESTRPARASLAPEPGTRWLGLQVKSAPESGDHATVEFVARCKVGGAPALRLHEVSRFVRIAGNWLYLDGQSPR